MCFFPKTSFRIVTGTLRVCVAAGLLMLSGCPTAPTAPTAPTDAPETGDLSYPRFYLEGRGPYGGERSRELTLPVSRTTVAVDPLPVFVETDIQSIEIARVELGLCLRFELKPAAARALHRISLQEHGSRLVLVLDGKPVGVRVIDDRIQDDYLYTFLEVPDEALPGMVEAMRVAIESVR